MPAVLEVVFATGMVLILACRPQVAPASAETGEEDEGCPAGMEGCPCDDDDCDDGLMCLSDLCVDPDSSPGVTSIASQTEGPMSTPTEDPTTEGTGDDTGGGTSCADATEWASLGYLWVSNSAEGTVSKIDTAAVEEVARYQTSPDGGFASPSRTAVNLYGDVIVANRGDLTAGYGSVTKIASHLEDCVDRDDSGSLDTSQGPGDVHPWRDECVLWNVDVPSSQYTAGPRPLGWELGPPDDCGSPDVDVWIGWYDDPIEGRFRLLDGEDGSTIEEVTSGNWSGLNYGPYGGATDGLGQFWVLGWQLGPLARIDPAGPSVELWDIPPSGGATDWTYGFALDGQGRPWIASAEHVIVFDPDAEEFDFILHGNGSTRGIAVDRQDRVFVAVDVSADGCGFAVVDGMAGTVISAFEAVGGCVTPVGVSLDGEGYVWLIDQGANSAFKIDPDTYAVLGTVSGLVEPYTYSDMTGANLYLVANPS